MTKQLFNIKLNSERSILAAIIAIAITIQLTWLILDRSMPTWDDASHLTNALNYHRVISHAHLFLADWWHELWAQSPSYTAPFIYILTVPFLAIFGKAVNSAILVNILFIIILVFTIYALSKSAFNTQISLWASGLVLMFPALLNVQTMYLLDYGVVSMSCLTFLTLTRWKDADTQRQSWQRCLIFGITFGCLMLSKPTGFLFLLVPIIYLLGSFIRARNWLGILQFGVVIIISWSIYGSWFSQNWLTVITSALGANAMGKAEGDPGGGTLAGWLYYVRILPDLISLPILITTTGFTLLWIFKRQLISNLFRNRHALWLLIYCCGGYFFCSLATNKDSRFILPIFPVIGIFIAASFNLFQTTWASKLRWVTVGITGFLISLNLFGGARVDNILKIPYIGYNLIHRIELKSFPHHQIIQEIVKEQPYLRSTIGVLASSPDLNAENLNLYGSLADFQVYARYFVNSTTDKPALIEKDLKSLNWYITKTGNNGYINPKILPAIEQNPQAQLEQTWQMPDRSIVKLYKRKNLPISVAPLTANIQKIQLEKITISPSAELGVNTTYQLSGDRDSLQHGLLLLTWQSADRTWQHDRAIGLGNLYLQHSDIHSFRVTENSVMLPPVKLPLAAYQLTATYLDRQTGKTFPLSVPKIEVRSTATNLFEPDPIAKLQQLSKLFAQGKIDSVFSQLNTLNQYDPTQNYLIQAQQALNYRIARGESQLDLKYTLALTQVLQRQIAPLLSTLTTISHQDPHNPHAWMYLGVVRLYNWQPQAAETAFEMAERLPSPPPELATLKLVSALFRFNLFEVWQRWK
ncbi:glycosyltransferase family 39 protein [Chamaesiphon sp.]|uniref:glycosyltransferase family 39 protein n=1 Tax=Chamaesiphon sp. TaxID=2814140 RepID=UPI003593A576